MVFRSSNDIKYDYLIVGCGFAGATFAERVATLYKQRSLIIDKRDHVGGNCHDKLEHGNLIHVYGPHYFRTNSERIFSYLSQFTSWIDAKYEILSWTDNQYWNFPINLNTFEQLIGHESTSQEMERTLDAWKLKIENPKNSEEMITSQVGQDLYEKFFKNYTIKQWRKDPKKLDPSVCGRIPVRTTRDNRYFNDKIQCLPEFGYTKLFHNILDNPLIKVELGVTIKDVDLTRFKRVVYTGPIDEYYDFVYGKLPYRSLTFEKEVHEKEFYQPAVQVNYPNDYEYTRIVETKHITKIQSDKTVIVKEYPANFEDTNEPFYPIPFRQSREQYNKYQELTKLDPKTIFIGRLATYQYLNMDQVIGMAISVANQIKDKHEQDR